MGQELEFAGCRGWRRAQEESENVGSRRNNSKRWDEAVGPECLELVIAEQSKQENAS